MATATRANAVGDLSDFQPHPPRLGSVESEQIECVTEENGFPSRQPAALADKPSGPAVRRHTTGRNQQLNVKATPETVVRFYRLADERRVVLGELLEQALEALKVATQPGLDNWLMLPYQRTPIAVEQEGRACPCRCAHPAIRRSTIAQAKLCRRGSAGDRRTLGHGPEDAMSAGALRFMS